MIDRVARALIREWEPVNSASIWAAMDEAERTYYRLKAQKMITLVAQAVSESAPESDVLYYPYERRRTEYEAIACDAIIAMLQQQDGA